MNTFESIEEDLYNSVYESPGGASNGKCDIRHELPTFHGEKACLKWSGWLQSQGPAGEFASPIGCGQYNCLTCGVKKLKGWIRKTCEAWVYAGYGRGIMMTFTLPWIRSRYNSEGFKVWQEPDKDYRARVGDERWAWYTENTLEENAQLIYKTWSSITRKFQRDTGVRLQYIASVELTRAGAPHLHVVVPESFAVLVCGNWGKIYNAKRLMIGLLQRQISQWFVTAWCTRTAEASTTAQHISFHGQLHSVPKPGEISSTFSNDQGASAAIAYVLKYILKDMAGSPWPLRHRRVRISRGFPFPKIGQAGAFEYVDINGEKQPFDRHTHDKMMGWWYYWKAKWHDEGRLPEHYSFPMLLTTIAWWRWALHRRAVEYRFLSKHGSDLIWSQPLTGMIEYQWQDGTITYEEWRRSG